ncbi:hypothetical protein GCM10010123_03230 [Pilimelia anulata]|uniref:Uncharacterized protein n=1 Tax=Pilimelia anulata TaxID=53371 RepID=A0A8J3F792_9ACTN|nr:HAD family hydrolase [Pilimelia anulata]GGJ76578.1 hypothetical protein GCM10010123_03230 [Pilimelia anulata]
MRRSPATALLIDLDGVVRRYDPAVAADLAARYGLDPHALRAEALRPAYRVPAILGRHDPARWRADVAAALAERVGGADAAAALVAEWAADRGAVDPAARELVAGVRAAGRPVALVAAATAELPAELAALGLAGAFDAVLNSADLGAAPPAPDFLAAACAAVGAAPADCLLVAADERAVRGARAQGLAAYRWAGGPADARYVRAALGVGPGDGGRLRSR